MTLIVIFATVAVIGVIFCAWQYGYESRTEARFPTEWRLAVGATCIGIAFAVLLFAVPGYISSQKTREVKCMQLLEEKRAIEQMIATEKNVDRLTLNTRVIDYNNRVIDARESSKRFIIGDYYSKAVDWDALETIEWQ